MHITFIISLTINIIIFLSSVVRAMNTTTTDSVKSHTFSTGTVLFSPSDISRECWSPESVALLTSRMLMSNAMPPVDRLTFSSKSTTSTDNRFVSDIIDYFRLLLQVVRTNTSGRTKHVMLLAVTDTMGGYMRHLVLPICKYAYYAGRVEYSSVIKLYQLYDELKNYLRTNGQGWARPWKRAGLHVQAEAISLQGPPPTSDPCKGVVYYKRTPADRGKHPRADGSGVGGGGGAMTGGGGNGDGGGRCSIEVPLPFFDSKTHPSAIAVPFRTFGLRNLESRVSAYILVKFYVAVSKCMASRNADEEDVQRFNANIFAFIVNKVMPHLCDDKFYAAFGGVLRVLETIKKVSKGKVVVTGNVNVMAEQQQQEDREPLDMSDEDGDGSASGTFDRSASHERRSKNNLILLAALATIIIWFCLGAAFICCRIKATKMRGKALQDGDDVDACKENTCPAYDTNVSSSHTTDYDVHERPAAHSSSRASKKSTTNTKSGGGSKSSKSTTGAASRSTTAEQDSDSQSATLGGDNSNKAPKIQVHSVQYYPPSFACHTSMTGKIKLDSSTEEYTSRGDDHHGVRGQSRIVANATGISNNNMASSNPNNQNQKRPYVFGYDFQTTSEESSPRDPTTDGADDDIGAGNLSK